MMTAGTLYQDFGDGDHSDQPKKPAGPEAGEDAMLEAFETGYQAGWDDSTKAQSSLDLSVSSALAANLQDASFQYHELRKQLTRTIRDITQGVVDAVLPEMARLSLGGHVVQLLEAHARNALQHRIELRVPDSAIDPVEQLLQGSPIDYDLIADPHMAPDQASLRLGDAEHVVDMGQVVQEVKTAIADYFEAQNSEENDDRSA